MATINWILGSGTWDGSTGTNWTGGVVPTSTDNVVFDTASSAASYTVTFNIGNACNDITIGPPLTGNVTFVGSAGNRVINVSGSFTNTDTAASVARLSFLATSAKTITSGGVSVGAGGGLTTFNGASGSWTLQDAFAAAGSVSLNQGTLNLNGFSASAISLSSVLTSARGLTFTGSETLTLLSSWSITSATNFTFTKASGTIKFTGGNGQFDGVGLTYANVWFAGSGTNTKTITGANTFDSLKVDGTLGVKTITLPASATQTITAASGLQIDGDGTHQTVLQSSSAGTPATISISSGTVSLTNVTVKDSTATGGATFNAFTTNGCVDGGGNTGWNFGAAPTAKLFRPSNLDGIGAGGPFFANPLAA